MSEIKATKTLDARGLLCPMPVVKAGKEMKTLAAGDVLEVLATDRGAIADFPAWADDTGNTLLGWHAEGDGTLVFYLRKGED